MHQNANLRQLKKNIESVLYRILQEILDEVEYPGFFAKVEHIRALALQRRNGDLSAEAEINEIIEKLFTDTELKEVHSIASALTLYFDLMNLAEEQQRISKLRKRRQAKNTKPDRDTIEEAIAKLKDAGVTAEQLSPLLDKLKIELIFTAHPSETRRRTIISKHQRISFIIHSLAHFDILPEEREAFEEELKAEILTIWLTNRAPVARPTVEDEVRTGLFYLDSTLWNVLPQLYSDLEKALAKYYPNTLAPKHAWLQMGSWIGGDRDGHPGVTHIVTAETLRLHRGLAVRRHSQSLHTLSRQLSLHVENSERRPSVLSELNGQTSLFAQHETFKHVLDLQKRYKNEPLRLTAAFLAAKLDRASEDDMKQRLLSAAPHSVFVRLNEFTDTLGEIGRLAPQTIAKARILPLYRQFEIFGLHASRLHIREDAEVLKKALAEILSVFMVDSQRLLKVGKPELQQVIDILHRDSSQTLAALETDRVLSQAHDLAIDLLANWLMSQPPDTLAEHVGVTEPTVETWELFRLIAHTREIYGPELIGSFIISMTHSPVDVLTVLLLAHWAFHSFKTSDNLGSKEWQYGAEGLQVVPLFETINALHHASHILAKLFELPQYRNHLGTCGNEQVIMLGYSDSNKDGGYLAANYELYTAQTSIANVCRQYKIRLTLTHGRGGTVARGGGPANRAILAQPPGTVNGRIGITEQGEIIGVNYSNPYLARRHIEQIVNAVLNTLNPIHNTQNVPPEWMEAMARMASAAQVAYQKLAKDKAFLKEFWEEVTPIWEIMRLQIGSRPATRPRSISEGLKVRAIPWVFSWMQSRFNLPGWYGLGTGLESLSDLSLLQQMYREWPFFRAILENAEMSLLKADMTIAEIYVQKLETPTLAKRQFFSDIKAEYERTREIVLAITEQQNLLNSLPTIQLSINRRNPYADPLNYIQAETLKRLYTLEEDLEYLQNEDNEHSKSRIAALEKQIVPLRKLIVITINGLAAALRNTG